MKELRLGCVMGTAKSGGVTPPSSRWEFFSKWVERSGSHGYAAVSVIEYCNGTFFSNHETVVYSPEVLALRFQLNHVHVKYDGF